MHRRAESAMGRAASSSISRTRTQSMWSMTKHGKTSVVVDANSGKVVAQIPNGEGVDGLAFDAAQKLIYIPDGRGGNVTVVHEDSPDKYTVLATVPTMQGARTITINARSHVAYVFTPEFGPPPANAPPPQPGRRGPRGPIIASWLIAVKHQGG